ncbi:MAG TPA: PAS domain S-box protein [Candidatus Atribacteria bacterium]|nr:PAS domain S-box protein [Candidatus Atribacteria bacterium]
MTIRNKTLVIIVIIFIMLIVGLYFILGSVFQQGFIRIEDKEAHDNVKQVVNILSREIDILDIFNRDWSSWDDTYTFIEDSNEEYIKSNLLNSTFIGGRLNLIIFINSSNQIVFGKAFDLEEEREIAIPVDLQKHLLSESLLTKPTDVDNSVKGIILLSKSPMLISSRPILTSEDGGPIRGALIMGRYFDSTEIERLSQISNLSIEIQKFNDPQAPLDFKKAFSILPEEPIFNQTLTDELIAGYALIRDIYGKPILVLRIDIPREIYRQSLISRRYLIFSILVIALIFSLLIFFLLQRLVLFPMAQMNKYLDIVTSTKDLSFRIPLKGKDEIAKLSDTINLMLEKLEASRKELWDSRELYKNLFNNMPGAFYRANKEGNVLVINPPGAKLLGFDSPEEISGKNIAQDLYYNPENRKRFLEELKKRKGSVKNYEVILKKRDDTPIIVSTSSHYYYDKEGNIAGVEGIFVDISERVEHEKIQQVLYNISKTANSPVSLNQLYRSIHQELGTIINANNFHLALLNQDENRIDYDYFVDEKDDHSVVLKNDNTGSLSAYVTKTGQPLLVNRVQIDKMIEKGELIQSHLGTLTENTLWLGVPLKIEGKVIGTMAVLTYTNPHLYSEKDIKLMEFTSYQIATAIKRKQDEEALYRSEQEFASLFNHSPEALVYEDVKSNIININPRFTELFGYTLKELKGKNLDEGMIHPEDKKEEGLRLAQNLTGFSDYETVRKKKNGTLIQVSISTSPVMIDNKLRGFITSYKDITERKKTEETLKKSEQEFASLFRNSPEALIYVNDKSSVLDINAQFTELFGFTLEEIKGRNINDGMIHPSDKIKEAKNLYQKSLSHGYYHYESIRKKKDGSLFPVIISCSPVIIEDKPKGRIISYRDITEIKKDEKLQQVLYSISKAANLSISLDQLYPIIHQELGTIIDTSNFYIALINQEESKLYFPYHFDELEDDFKPQSLEEKCLTCYVVKNKRSMLLNYEKIKKLQENGELLDAGVITKDIFWFGVPLMVENKVIGAMAIQSYRSPNPYSQKDTALLEFVSSQVATAIERKRMEEELKRFAHYDTLTGAYNRGYGLELLQRQIKMSKRDRSPLLLAYSDLDNLKDINDRFGHEEGDLAMIKVAKLFKSILREVDIIIRMGGDEFLVIFLDSSLREIPIIRKRLSQELTRLNQISKKPYQVEFSTGFSTYDPATPIAIDELIRIADEEMYEDKKSKNKGR